VVETKGIRTALSGGGEGPLGADCRVQGYLLDAGARAGRA